MHKVVLLRHGESAWNKENKFTGWTDVGLTEKGVEEARSAGQLLREDGYKFDCAYTSVLSRAIKTLWVALEEMNLMWIPIHNTWRLNERHYGALQGLNKVETAERYGEEQVQVWRRSYAVQPPPVDPADPRSATNDERYRAKRPEELPRTESLKDVLARLEPYWNGTIVPTIKGGQQVVIAAHGNSLRALVKHLDGISDETIAELDIPTGVPLVYELDDDLHPVRHFYLGDQQAIAAAAAAVAAQAKRAGPAAVGAWVLPSPPS